MSKNFWILILLLGALELNVARLQRPGLNRQHVCHDEHGPKTRNTRTMWISFLSICGTALTDLVFEACQKHRKHQLQLELRDFHPGARAAA
jgi:hypothetical protein